MNITSTFACVGLCNGLASVLVGCMNLTPVYDEHFGEVVHMVRATQTLNPNASISNDPVSGADGRVVMSAMGCYSIQYRAPQLDVSVFTVGVSSGNSPDSVDK